MSVPQGCLEEGTGFPGTGVIQAVTRCHVAAGNRTLVFWKRRLLLILSHLTSTLWEKKTESLSQRKKKEERKERRKETWLE